MFKINRLRAARPEACVEPVHPVRYPAIAPTEVVIVVVVMVLGVALTESGMQGFGVLDLLAGAGFLGVRLVRAARPVTAGPAATRSAALPPA